TPPGNPRPVNPGDPIIAFAPQLVLSQIVLPGAGMTVNGVLQLQGQFAQKLTEGTTSANAVVNYQMTVSEEIAVVPPTSTGALASIAALYKGSGMMTVALYLPGATTPSLLTKASISFQGDLSGSLHPPTPITPGSPLMSQEMDAMFNETTMLSQTETSASGSQVWMVQATVNSTGNSSATGAPSQPTRETSSVQDHIQESVAPVTS